MFDLLIQNATVYDGTGSDPFLGDVAVLDGKIAAVGHGLGSARQTVDAQGLSLSPGFIDAHSHADGTVFAHPERHHVLKMGVTTEICGSCGISYAPVDAEDLAVLYNLSGTSAYQHRFFRTFRQELEAINGLPLGPNLAIFTGHAPLRYSAMGTENRAPTPKELQKMQEDLVQAMKEGALGYTTGLSYVPGIYSKKDELAALAKAMAPYDGIYASHSRSESAGLFKSVPECIDIAEEAGVTVVISHFKCTGKTFWNWCAPALQMIDEANSRGLQIHLDAYPYIACSTTTTSAIPPRFLDQGPEAFAQSLSNPKIVEDIRKEIYEIDDPGWDNSALHVGLENFLIVGADYTPEFVGLSYAQVGQKLGITPFDAMIRLLRLNHGLVRDVRYSMCEENVEMILAHPRCVVGSDGIYAKGRDTTCHPRAFGTFPRYLGHYIRDRQILSRQEGIRRITGQTADLYSLKGKGYIRVGYDADLVLFDFDRIIDHADFQDPFKPNEGIHRVYMRGQLVLGDNTPTGIYAGRCLDNRYLQKG